MKTSLIISSTNSNGVSKQKTIPYVNPNATNQEMVQFGEGLVNLTNATYGGTYRIDKINCDTEPDPNV